MQSILWIMVIAAVLHVFEEYHFNFVGWVQKHYIKITLNEFIVINSLFILLTVIGAIVFSVFPILSFSVGSLIFINALIHIAASIKFKNYTPGLFTSLILYLPLSITLFIIGFHLAILTKNQLVISFLLGVI